MDAINPHQAKTAADLVSRFQLNRLDSMFKRLGVSKEEAARELFGCPVTSLSEEAAKRLAALTRYKLDRHRARKFGVKTRKVNRILIIRRDGLTCYLCHKKLSLHEITLDHVIPLNRGGEHSEDNLRVACRPCHERKDNQPPKERKAVEAQAGERAA